MKHISDSKKYKQIVAHGYDQVSETYARLECEGEWPRMRWLRKLLQIIESRSSLLGLGCGSGDPADIEIAKQHYITGVDISQVQIQLARRNVPTGTFLQGDVSSMKFPGSSFDAVVSFYTLEHIPREEHALIFKDIHFWLRTGGYLLISTEADDCEGIIAKWLGVPMYMSSFDSEMVIRLVEEAGYTLLETEIEAQTEQGHEIPYLWILARKP